MAEGLIRVGGVGKQRDDRIRNARKDGGGTPQIRESEPRELGEGDRTAAQSASRFASSSNGVTCERYPAHSRRLFSST